MSITDIPSLSVAAPRRACPAQFHPARYFRWLIRPRRILLGLAALWIINIFDLGYTLAEAKRLTFVEANPVAAQLIRGPAHALIAYKTILVVIGSTILLTFRRHRVAELTCWFMLATYTFVAVRWCLYYGNLLDTINDPANPVQFHVNAFVP